MNIIKGEIVDTTQAHCFLNELDAVFCDTLKRPLLDIETVIAAADTLSQNLSTDKAVSILALFGLSRLAAKDMAAQARRFLSRDYLTQKIARELGGTDAHRYGGHIERFSPLGVITHISAGNAAGLPAFSVLEGLLAGNINILKLPGSDDRLSTTMLKMLIDIEPRLAEYIYVFDFPSTDTEAIKKMVFASDAVAVWGSDFTVSGIRSLTPPQIPIIEWGHKLSFACVTKQGETHDALRGIADDICRSEQLLCNAPQCVYYEADTFYDLTAFAQRFFEVLASFHALYPAPAPDPAAQAEITALLALCSAEALVEDKAVLYGDGFNVIVDNSNELVASPGYRTVWIKPIHRDSFFDVLRDKKGYLQTVGISCSPHELSYYTHTLTACGACRIVPCGAMLSNTPGEPHDGRFALRQYVKTIISPIPSKL